MNSPNNPLRRGSAGPAGLGLALALSAGMVDVCLALLNKPRGFDTLTAVPPAILAVAAVALPVYLLLWTMVRPAAVRAGLDARAAMVSLAVFEGVAFTVALLAGLHAAPFSPQTVF